MENATKALSIAANILLAVMILSVIMYMYNKIRVHPIEQEKALLVEQAEEFNRQFEVYDKKIMYGTDVLSAVNKAISNNEKYVTGKWLSGALSPTEHAIDIQVVLKDPLEEKVEVFYDYTPDYDTVGNNISIYSGSPVKDRPYTTGKGVSALQFDDIVNKPEITAPKFQVPGGDTNNPATYTYLDLYEGAPANWGVNLFSLTTHTIPMKKTLNSEEASASAGSVGIIYNVLPGGEYSKNAIARKDVYLKVLVDSIKTLTTSNYQMIYNKNNVDYRDPADYKKINGMIYPAENSTVEFDLGSSEMAWSALKWTPAVSDFKNRKFKCVAVDETGKPIINATTGYPESGIEYNEDTGAIWKITFVEYSIN